MEKTVIFRAYQVSRNLDLARAQANNPGLVLFRKERNVRVFKINDNEFFAVYSFGAVVFMDIANEERIVRLINSVLPEEENHTFDFSKVLFEETPVYVGSDADVVENDDIKVISLVPDKLMIILNAFATSVSIDYLENQAEESLREYSQVNLSLAKYGHVSMRNKRIMKMIGSAGSMMHFIIGNISLLDKPDVTWENREAEILFMNLRKMFELDERFKTLRYKLDFIRDNSVTMLEAIQSKRAEWLEWIIIALFVLEIVMAFVGLM